MQQSVLHDKAVIILTSTKIYTHHNIQRVFVMQLLVDVHRLLWPYFFFWKNLNTWYWKISHAFNLFATLFYPLSVQNETSSKEGFSTVSAIQINLHFNHLAFASRWQKALGYLTYWTSSLTLMTHRSTHLK